MLLMANILLSKQSYSALGLEMSMTWETLPPALDNVQHRPYIVQLCNWEGAFWFMSNKDSTLHVYEKKKRV